MVIAKVLWPSISLSFNMFPSLFIKWLAKVWVGSETTSTLQILSDLIQVVQDLVSISVSHTDPKVSELT